jgi:hypothetical protein
MSEPDPLSKWIEQYRRQLYQPTPPIRLPVFTSPQPPKRVLRFAPKPTSKPIVFLRKPRVFVSFDYEYNANYKRLLEAWSKNSRFQFTFQDMTPQEIQTNSVARVKGVLTTKVKEATHTLVIVGRYSNTRHKDAVAIGCKNWINYEIQQSRAYKKKLVVVRLEPQFVLPDQLNGASGILVEGFNHANIIQALKDVK